MKIELKWSDEDVWKFWRELKPDETPEQALEACRLQWEETKKHATLNYECEFRCTNQ